MLAYMATKEQKMAGMELDMMVNMEVDMVANKVADMVADKKERKWTTWSWTWW